MPGLGKTIGKAFRAGIKETRGPTPDIFAKAIPLQGEPKQWLKQIVKGGPSATYKLPSDAPVHFEYPGYVILQTPKGQYLVNQQLAEEAGVKMRPIAAPRTDLVDNPIDEVGGPDIMKALGLAVGAGAGAYGAGSVAQGMQHALYGNRRDS